MGFIIIGAVFAAAALLYVAAWALKQGSATSPAVTVTPKAKKK